jgi:hypothetical protein
MSLTDFITKKRTEVVEQGPYYAAKTGLQEAALKALNPVAQRKATPIWASDADIILVLDSCRYDLWKDVVGADNSLVQTMAEYSDGMQLPQNTESRWSVGSASPQWISETFAPQYKPHWKKAGYVTGNAFSGKQPGTHRSDAVYPLRGLDLAYLDEPWTVAWDTGSLEMVEPEVLTDRGLWAWQRKDELGIDRLVVHYMQPHVPFRSQPEWNDGWDSKTTFGTESDATKKSEWKKLRDGEIGETEFWEAYRDNLIYVLEEVSRWLNGTNANILITSDHGNAMGEFGQWGHPPGHANPYIRKVPWVEVKGQKRELPFKELEKEPPAVSGGNREQIEEQLQALGYR